MSDFSEMAAHVKKQMEGLQVIIAAPSYGRRLEPVDALIMVHVAKPRSHEDNVHSFFLHQSKSRIDRVDGAHAALFIPFDEATMIDNINNAEFYR